MLEHPRCDLRLVHRKAENDRRRRVLRKRKRTCKLGPYQRRGIVQQRDQGGLCRRAILVAQIGIEIGARQGGGCIAALGSGSRAHPLQKLTSDHWYTRCAPAAGRAFCMAKV
jgi:hypothetical protein